VEINEPFFALIGLILFLVLLVYLGVHRSVGGALDKRSAAIADELDAARKLRAEAEALLTQYRQKTAGAEAEATAIVDQARREADALGVEARKRLEEYVAGRTRLAEQKIAQAESQAIQDVRSLSADVAIAAAERIISSKVKGDAGNALIDRSIADVRGKLN
jgi:F-type H+-transporting ATPase subunit b